MKCAENFLLQGDMLLFSASEPKHGPQLWQFPLG